MHELALARSLIELVDEYAGENGCEQVLRVRVRLGVMSAMTRALYFCFRSAARGSTCEGAVLEIEEVPLTVNCRSCNEVKTPSGRYNFRCPDCGLPTPEVVTGREMQLTSIELKHRSPAASHRPEVPRTESSQQSDAGQGAAHAG